MPRQAGGSSELSDIAKPGKLRPAVLGGVDAKGQEQIFRRQRTALTISELDRSRPLEARFHIKIDSVEARKDAPLQLDHISAAWTVQNLFVSGAQESAGFEFGKLRVAMVSEIGQDKLGAGHIARANQEIEIIELALGDVAVEQTGQSWTLVGDDIDARELHAVENSVQLLGEP